MTEIHPSPTRLQWLLRSLGRLPIPKLRGIYARLPVFRDDSEREFVVEFATLQYRGTLAQFVDRNIFYFGCYSPQELVFLAVAARALRRHREALTLVDVGANVGQHSLFMASHVQRVVAFEPNNQVADRFQANISLNRIGNIELVRAALGSEQAEGQLGSGFANNSGSRSLVWSLDDTKNTTVPIVRGDDTLARLKVDRLDILKIDVEGFEKEVLLGLQATLRKDRPIILFELVGTTVKGGFASEDELRRTLYPECELYTLGGSQVPQLLPFDWGAEEAVCIPKELVAEIQSAIGLEGASIRF